MQLEKQESKNGNKQELEEYPISNYAIRCFARESTVWAEFSRKGSSLAQMVLPRVAQKPGAEITQGLLTSSWVCWLDLLQMNSPGTSDSQGTMIRYKSEYPKRTRQKLYHLSQHGPRTHISFLQEF